jgi:ubiquinone/menaquinone biosynthesis C-methylase UbiE
MRTKLPRYLSEQDWDRYFRHYWILSQLRPYRDLRADLVSSAGIEKDMKVLDAACGPGLFAEAVCQLGARYYGVDLSDSALRLAESKCGSLSSATFRKGDLRQKLDFENCFFDRVICNNALYILTSEDSERVLAEFARALKPGGKVVLSEPARGFSTLTIFRAGVISEIQDRGLWSTILTMVRQAGSISTVLRMNSRITREAASGSYRFFTSDELLSLLVRAGFRVERSFEGYARQNVCVLGVRDAP